MTNTSKPNYFTQLYKIINAQNAIIQDDKDGLPEEQLKEKQESIQEQLKKQDIYDRKQDRKQRKIFAEQIFCLLCVYLMIVGLIIIGCAKQNNKFSLSDTVLIVLITTTTANVIGIFMLVVKYLFNTRSDINATNISENTILRIINTLLKKRDVS